MLQGLFYISLFFITILGILLLRPTRSPIETRNQVTREMAQFLEKTPEILSHPPHVNPIHKNLNSPPLHPAEVITPNPVSSLTQSQSKPIDVPFQGSSLHFQNLDDYNQWLYETASRDAEGFLKNLDPSLDPELKLDILKKVGDLESPPATKELTKELLLAEAEALLKVGDGGHEQLAEKYLNAYLEKEADAALAKKRVDALLKSSNKPHP